MTKRATITQWEIIQGVVFTTRVGGRYYFKESKTGLNKIINDIDKTQYCDVEFVDKQKIVAVFTFFGIKIRIKLLISDCFKLIDT